MRYDDSRTRAVTFRQLPLSKLPADFFPVTCRACVDYTNVLADITVGYMVGEGEQWLLVRNERNERSNLRRLLIDHIVATACDRLRHNLSRSSAYECLGNGRKKR